MKKVANFGNLHICIQKNRRGGGLRVKIGHHKIGAYAEMGQNRIRGGWGVKKTQKTSDIIYVRSLNELNWLFYLLYYLFFRTKYENSRRPWTPLQIRFRHQFDLQNNPKLFGNYWLTNQYLIIWIEYSIHLFFRTKYDNSRRPWTPHQVRFCHQFDLRNPKLSGKTQLCHLVSKRSLTRQKSSL